MAIEKWTTGAVASYTAATGTTDLNSLANGSSILSSVQLNNATNLDVFCDISVSLGSVTTGSGTPYIGVYLLPLNEDGTTYGNGIPTTTASANLPPPQYWVGNIMCQVSTAAVITGTIRAVIMPPSAFKLAIYNNAGVALASSGNVVDYKTYNRSVA